MAALPSVCFVGAGTVNFGYGDHPWNHSKRLEMLGNVKIVAIVDPFTDKARTVLKEKMSSEHAPLYKDCHIYGDIEAAMADEHIDVAFIGLPPSCHGSFTDNKDVELRLLKKGIHLFVEKPVSVATPEEFRLYVDSVEGLASQSGRVISVGYMFRYHPAIERIKDELTKHGRPIIAVNARYSCAYSDLGKPFWWHIDQSGGPIVEQATHFCDIIRYIVGEVDLSSIQGLAVPLSDDPTNAGHLSAIPDVVKNAGIPKEKEIPCASQATWRFQSGGIGSLTHTVTLYGFRYESFIDIWCDGLRLSLNNPYTDDCTLSIRRKESEHEIIERFPNADPYFVEDKYFLDAVQSGTQSGIRSSYSDAAKTYELTWAIRRATAGR